MLYSDENEGTHYTGINRNESYKNNAEQESSLQKYTQSTLKWFDLNKA